MICELNRSPTIQNPTFEGKILNRYNPLDNSKNPYAQESNNYVINVDAIDKKGFETITIKAYNKDICNMFSSILQIGKTIRVNNFVLREKSKWEHGDSRQSINLTKQSNIIQIPQWITDVFPNFYSNNCIALFRE